MDAKGVRCSSTDPNLAQYKMLIHRSFDQLRPGFWYEGGASNYAPAISVFLNVEFP